MTVASDLPKEPGAEYRKVFKRLGAGEVIVVAASRREDTQSERAMKALEEATAVFFTGGDQLHSLPERKPLIPEGSTRRG